MINYFLRNDFITPILGAALIRREVFEKVGKYEDNFHGFHEDQVFLTKLCMKEPVFATDICWHKYRQHPNSYCNVWRKKEREYNERLAFLTWVESYVLRHAISCTGFAYKELRKVLSQCLFPYRHPILFKLLRIIRNIKKRLKMALKLVI